MEQYIENEIKILDVNISQLQKAFETMGAKKVFDADRTFITFDAKKDSLLSKEIIIRLTVEDKLKLSISSVKNGEKRTVKLFTSRLRETIDFFKVLDIVPVAKVKSHRISYELGNVDFDIDKFPLIPSFVEIDLKYLNMPPRVLLSRLGLENKEIFEGGTEDLFEKYGYNYFEVFKV